MWRRLLCFIILFFLFFFPKKVYAIPLSITQSPKDISSEFSVSVTMFGAKPATNYFRIILYKEGTHMNVSETWNGSHWYSGSNEKEYPSFSVGSGNETHELKGKFKDGTSSGEYLLSVQRYTASGNAADDSITPVKVNIAAPSTPVPTKTAEPTPIPTVVLTPPPLAKQKDLTEENNDVLAATEEVSTNKTTTTDPSPHVPAETYSHPEGREETLVIALALSGILCIGIGTTIFVRRYKHWYTNRTSV